MGYGKLENDPQRIAQLFAKHLNERSQYFDSVVFAIADWSEDRRFTAIFSLFFHCREFDMKLEDLGAILAEQFIPHIMRSDEEDILIAYPMRHYKGSEGQRDLMMRMSISRMKMWCDSGVFDYGLSEYKWNQGRCCFDCY